MKYNNKSITLGSYSKTNLGDELILHCEESKKLFVLNHTATKIFTHFEQLAEEHTRISIDAIIELLHEQYDTSSTNISQMMSDISNTVELLTDNDILHLGD